MTWMISANGKIYDHASAFAAFGFIDWRQVNRHYNVGDIVYIYCTKPLKKIMFKCVVTKINIPFEDIQDDKTFWKDISEYESAKTGKYVRLKFLEQVDSEYLTLDNLREYGIKSAPQGPMKLNNSLLIEYIEKHFNDCYSEGFFPDISPNEQHHEGHVTTVLADKYERSSIARRKCIEYHGTKCMICGFDFEEQYGEIGKGFIHVHHLKPLHTIKTDYIVNYKKDLVPVCPNCHAMIHRILNDQELCVEDLKKKLGKK